MARSVGPDEQREPGQPATIGGESPARIRGLPRRIGGGVGRLIRRLAEGIPTSFVVVLAALVLVAILYTVATREPKEPRGYAEFTLSSGGCTVDAAKHLNAPTCQRVTDGVYRITFTKSIRGSTVLASRGSCCPGIIGASIESDRAALVVVERRVTRNIRATVFVP